MGNQHNLINPIVTKDYKLIYDWLKKTGTKLASDNTWGKNALTLIEHLPTPKFATEAEIKAIAVEISIGVFELFYNEIDNVSGQKLSDLAEEIRSAFNDDCNLHSQADMENSKITPYLLHYKNADSKKMASARSTFSNYAIYFSKYNLIGIVLDGESEGLGVLVRQGYSILGNDGEFNNDNDDEIMLLNFNCLSRGNWCAGVFATKDIKQIKVEHFMKFAYLTVAFKDKEATTLYIEK